MSFIFTPTEIPEVLLIETKRFEDDRGFFSETFRASEFEEHGLPPFVQENHSRSVPTTFRGFHYQINPKPQAKLVYCVSGSIWDMAIDIRKKSRTYGTSVGVELSEENGKMLYIPEGFAHGFLALDRSHVVYKVTEYYSPEHDRCIRWDDESIGVKWPVGIENVQHMNISNKDRAAPLLVNADNNFTI